MKKFISVILSAIVLFSAFAVVNVSVSAEESKSDFEYNVLSNNTASLTSYDGSSKSIAVPARIDGYTVTTISSDCFAYNTELENVVIPSSVTSIGSFAFYDCKSLRTVTIPDSVTSIRSSAFFDCESLEKARLPKGLTEIDDCIFFGCKRLAEINIPDKVRSIGANAFLDCESLKKISMPNSVRTIGKSAFSGAKSLEEVKLSSELKKIPSSAFSDTESLSKIKLPKNVKEISSIAFYNSGIKSVSLSRYVKKLGEYAFGNCKSLTKITVNKKNTAFSSKKGVLFNKKKSTLITYPAGKSSKSYTTPKSLRTIKDKAFEGNQKLSTLKLSKGLKTIESEALQATAIAKLNLPGTLKTIGQNAFYECKNLKKVKLPSSVTKVCSKAFSDCDNLRSVNFKGNKSLSLGHEIFANCKLLKKTVYPVCKKSGGMMFYNCKSLSKVSISSNVKKIYEEDFAECPRLKKITIPSSVKSIGKYAVGYVNYYDGEYDKNFDLTIKCKKGSAAYKYAKKNDFDYKKL